MSSTSAMLPKPPMPSRIARLFAERAGLYCLSALVAGTLCAASLTILSLYTLGGLSPPDASPVMLWRAMSSGQKLIWIFGFIFALWTPVLLAARATCRIAAAQLAGQELTLATLVADGLRFIPSALVYSLIIGLPAMMGASCFFIPGILIASLFTLVVPAGVNEPGGTFSALRRGFSLNGKVFGRSFLLTALSAAAIALVIAVRIAGVDRFLPSSGAAWFVLRFAVSYVPALLLLVLTNISFTLLYYEARRAENPMAYSATTSQP